jgi:hypothetical protein
MSSGDSSSGHPDPGGIVRGLPTLEEYALSAESIIDKLI